MSINRPSSPTRSQLAAISGNDPSLLRAFQDLFAVVPSQFDVISGDLASILNQIDEARSNNDAIVATLLKLLQQPDIRLISGNVTTDNSCWLRVDTTCIVNLNPFPVDNEQVVIQLIADNITVSVTDGVGTNLLTVNGTTLSYRYNAELQEWIIGS